MELERFLGFQKEKVRKREKRRKEWEKRVTKPAGKEGDHAIIP